MAKKEKFFWWHGSDLTDFFTKGTSLAETSFRVEFHPKEEFGLKLIPLGAVIQHEGEHEFNVVHACPPVCPD